MNETKMMSKVIRMNYSAGQACTLARTHLLMYESIIVHIKCIALQKNALEFLLNIH